MTMKQRNRKIIYGAAILVLIVGAVLGGLGISRVYARNQAQAAARQYLPATAAFVSYHDADSIYIFRFFDAGQQERSEIEVDKSNGQVRKMQTQKAAYIYPDTMDLTEDTLKEIVWKEVPDAAIKDVILHEQTAGKYVSITYTSEDCRGEYLIDPANGSVIARTVKYGRPVVIPSSGGDKIGLLTLTELKTIGNQKIPGAVFQDLDIKYDDGKFVAEIDMYLNGIKHVLVLDAGSGEELAYDSFKDDWKKYGNWEPRELETPLLNIVNLNSSLELSKSAIASDKAAAPSGIPVISETQSAVEETTAAIPSETTGTQPISTWVPAQTPTPQITPKPTAAATPTATTTTTPPATTPAVTQAPTVPADADPGVIGLDRAKSLVLSRLPGAVFEAIDLDEEDGRFLYKGNAVSGTTEVNFEIDAYTGTFAKWDVDTNND